jgi:hypothetical protein
MQQYVMILRCLKLKTIFRIKSCFCSCSRSCCCCRSCSHFRSSSNSNVLHSRCLVGCKQSRCCSTTNHKLSRSDDSTINWEKVLELNDLRKLARPLNKHIYFKFHHHFKISQPHHHSYFVPLILSSSFNSSIMFPFCSSDNFSNVSSAKNNSSFNFLSPSNSFNNRIMAAYGFLNHL